MLKSQHDEFPDIESHLVQLDSAVDSLRVAITKSPYWVVKDWTNVGDPYLERTVVLIPMHMTGHSLAIYSVFKHLFRFKAGFEFIFVMASVQFVATLLFALLGAETILARSPKVRKWLYAALVQGGFTQYGVFLYIVVSFLFVLWTVMMTGIGQELIFLAVSLIPTMFEELARARGWKYMMKFHKDDWHDTDPEEDRYRTEDLCMVLLFVCDIFRCATAMAVAQALWRANGYPSLLPSYGAVVTVAATGARYVTHLLWFNMFVLWTTILVCYVVTVTAIVEIHYLY